MPAPTHVTVSPRSFACNLATICAPTLAGLKPASLFRYQPASGQDGTAMAVAWHALLAPRGVTVRVLKACPVTGAVLVYVYRPTQVAAILQRGDVQDFLQSEGYTPGDAESMLAQLSQRLCCEEDFPHEIGVFLGYPPASAPPPCWTPGAKSWTKPWTPRMPLTPCGPSSMPRCAAGRTP